MQKFILVVILAFVVSCSSKPKTAEVPVTTPVSTENTDVTVVDGPHNIRDVIAVALTAALPRGMSYEVIDNKNGYAKAVGPMEGFHEYFLFTAAKKNLLVKVAWDCGPACTQIVSFFEVSGEQSKEVSLKNILTSNTYAKFINAFASCVEGNKFGAHAKAKNCELMFAFPKVGTDVDLYQATDHEDEKFKNRDGSDAMKLGRLAWNKAAFKFNLLK